MDNNKNQEISKELKELSLAVYRHIPSEKSFDVPEAYFDQLEDEILAQTSVSTFMGKKDLHEVPNGFFTANEEQIMHNLVGGKTRKVPDWLYMAASIVLLVMCIIPWNSTQEQAPVSGEEMAFLYLEDNVDDWELEDMIHQEIINETTVADWTNDAPSWTDSVSMDFILE